MRIDFNYQCGHTVSRDLDMRFAANQSDARRARAGTFAERCPDCRKEAVNDFIECADEETLRATLREVSTLRAVRDVIFRKEKSEK